MRDYENKCARNGYDETDSSEEEEVLFGQGESEQRSLEETDQRSSEESAKETSINTTSFWGGRVNKQSSLDSFVRRRKK
jgi:hypothetical protein